MAVLGSCAFKPARARRRAPLLAVIVTLLVTQVNAVNCPAASSKALALGIDIAQDSACETGDSVTGCISTSCRLCQSFATAKSQRYQLCPSPSERALGSADANKCSLSVSPGDAAAGLNILTDASCANGGLGCILANCRFCTVPGTSASSPYLSCSEISSTPPSAPTPAPMPKRQPPSDGGLPDTPRTNYCSANLIGLDLLNAGVWAFVDESGCLANPTACSLRFCRFCRYSDSTASLAYTPCPREGSDEQWLLSYAG
ncbi:hypothetical protein Gpo141_00005226 [Globisporangium polare]